MCCSLFTGFASTVNFAPSYSATHWMVDFGSLVVIASAYHFVFCACAVCMCDVCYYVVCTLHVCVAMCCVTRTLFHPWGRHGPVVSESVDVWYMVSRVKYCDVVLADSAHCGSVVLVGCSMFLTRELLHAGWCERRGCKVHWSRADSVWVDQSGDTDAGN